MLFSEIYGNYFNTVAAILDEALKKPVTDQRIREIVVQRAFGESNLTIPAALADGRWPLIDQDGHARIKHEPEMPLTLLQKRWLKSLLCDSRISLFQPSFVGIEDVKPLFTPEDIVYFDQYADGDPYENPVYREHFHIALTAIKEKQKLALRLVSRKGEEATVICVPYRLEYSLKDDKFRIIGVTKNHRLIVNMARLLSCRYAGKYDQEEYLMRPVMKEKLVLRLTDERNALERCMLHFSDFEKQTEKIDDGHYRFLIQYDKADETEVLIRVISFGPKLEVISPQSFRNKIRDRLMRQNKNVRIGAGNDGKMC